MEHEVTYFRRESAFGRLTRSGPLQWVDSVRIAAGVADELARAHACGTVHGAVSPQHVLLGATDQPVLTGFGDTPPAIESTDAIPELLHTAPEVLDGDRPRPAADIYSLGATLHHLLTGLPPFPLRPQDTFASWFVRIVMQPAPALPAHLPADLRRLVGSALAKDRFDRPTSATEFATRLRHLLPVVGVGRAIPMRRRPPES
jgi:serine/threonine protein kinase